MKSLIPLQYPWRYVGLLRHSSSSLDQLSQCRATSLRSQSSLRLLVDAVSDSETYTATSLNQAVTGKGMWPNGGRSLDMGSACGRNCTMTRTSDHPDTLYVSCFKPSSSCKNLEAQGLGASGDRLKIDYRCMKSITPRIKFHAPDGKQTGSDISANVFWPQYFCTAMAKDQVSRTLTRHQRTRF
jgi:hypothetical protein